MTWVPSFSSALSHPTLIVVVCAVNHCHASPESITNIHRWPGQVLPASRTEKSATHCGCKGTFCLTYKRSWHLKLLQQGISTIQRAVINIKEKDDAKGKKGDKELLVEGYGLQKVMVTEGSSTYSSV
jgi:hypothetical protein